LRPTAIHAIVSAQPLVANAAVSKNTRAPQPTEMSPPWTSTGRVSVDRCGDVDDGAVRQATFG
jgi:hypothetical protein